MIGAPARSAHGVEPERRQVQEIQVQPGQSGPAPARFDHSVSGYLLGLMLLACVLVLPAGQVVVHMRGGP